MRIVFALLVVGLLVASYYMAEGNSGEYIIVRQGETYEYGTDMVSLEYVSCGTMLSEKNAYVKYNGQDYSDKVFIGDSLTLGEEKFLITSMFCDLDGTKYIVLKK